ncbi:hypothetical protein [Synechococcus sp. PCC 7336]|uniref:hypothetical protein n=1 Tax=Synechococcus sp. PCC 7336 TaxID=195250 RepID=UPI00034C553F|nr:hypothetical protein [Synechococcus sp. PCC 7336]
MNFATLSRTWAIAIALFAYIVLGPALAGLMELLPQILLVLSFPVAISYLLIQLDRTSD